MISSGGMPRRRMSITQSSAMTIMSSHASVRWKSLARAIAQPRHVGYAHEPMTMSGIPSRVASTQPRTLSGGHQFEASDASHAWRSRRSVPAPRVADSPQAAARGFVYVVSPSKLPVRRRSAGEADIIS